MAGATECLSPVMQRVKNCDLCTESTHTTDPPASQPHPTPRHLSSTEGQPHQTPRRLPSSEGQPHQTLRRLPSTEGKVKTRRSPLAQALAEDISLEKLPELGELSPADVSVLREVGKMPAENRFWNTSEKPSAKTAALILLRLPEFSSFDERTLRIFCHACQWRQCKKFDVIGEQGSEQHEFFVIISGTVLGYACGGRHGKAKVGVEKIGHAESEPVRSQGEPQTPHPPIRRTRSASDMTQYGEEISQKHSGSSVGIEALFVGWSHWPITYVAHTKVEVLAVPRFALENIERTLKWSFDFRSLVNVLKELKAATNKRLLLKKADGEAEVRAEEWVTKISAAMQEVPFFRQLPSGAVAALAHSIEVLEFESRQVLWQQSQGTGPAADYSVEKSDEEQEDPAGLLHVVLKGQVWAFKKDCAASKDRTPTKLEDIWRESDRLFDKYGSSSQTLIECDSMGEPSQFSHEYTMIVDPGTVLVRICNPKHAKIVKNSDIIYQYGSLHRLLRMSSAERSELNKERLNHMVVQNLSFFNHIAKGQIAKLLEHATVRRLLPGDILLKQGEEADCLYIILSGHATSYHCPDIAVPTLYNMWRKWEIIRAKGGYAALGPIKQHLSVGSFTGESQVVEKALYPVTVVADSEMEAIRISASAYTTVMWDLCDGEPVDVDLIRKILSTPAHERTKQDYDRLMDMLVDSDFLKLFRGSDLLRSMTDVMTIIDCNAGCLITKQDSIGDTLFLVVSGSVALHSRTPGSELPRANQAHSKLLNLGPCRRVLGVGDSFGELAFVQSRSQPTSAIARSDSTIIALRRSDMPPQSVSRMVALIENPRGETVEEVFEKDIADRNEKDILLLVNYFEMNPFLKQLAYPALIACTRIALLHKLKVGEHLRTEDGSEKITETHVFIVNEGSMQITPDVRGSAFAEQLQDTSSQSPTFAEKTALSKRFKESRNQHLLFSGQMFFGSVTAPQQDESKQGSKEARLAPLRRRVFAVNMSGSITHTTSIVQEESILVVFGHVSEISSVQKASLPRFPYAIKICMRGSYYVLAGVYRSECDKFIQVLCDFNPYFDDNFRHPVWVQEQLKMLHGELGWKEIMLRIKTDGELLYSSLEACYPAMLDTKGDEQWLSLGFLQQCTKCEAFRTKDKPWALQLTIESKIKDGHSTTYVFNAGTQNDYEAWLDRFCMKCKPEVLNARFQETGILGHDNDHSSMDSSVKGAFGVAIMSREAVLIRALLKRFVDNKRIKQQEAKLLVSRAVHTGSNAKGNAKSNTLQPESSIDASVFVAYGSAFRVRGTGRANDEGCELFSIPASEWDRIKVQQFELQFEDAVRLLRTVPMLARTSVKDLHNLVQNSFVHHFHIGEVNACSALSAQHVYIILEGTCRLRRACQREKHIDKVRKQAIASMQGSVPGLVKVDCHACQGRGVVEPVPSIADRIKLCKVCRGLGHALHKDEEHTTEIGELRRGSVLSEAIARSHSLDDYEMLGCTPFQLLAIKLEQWTDMKTKWERLGTAAPRLPQAATLAEKLLDNASAVRKAVKRGHVEHVHAPQNFVKVLSVEEKASRLMDKSHSARMREIDSLLNVSRKPPKEIFVKTQREARPSVCTLAPPKTLMNRFATGLVPKLNLEPIFGDDLRGVFLSNLPVSERIFGAQGRPKSFLGSNVSIKLEPLSNTVITRDLPEALVTSRPAQKLDDLGYARKVTLKYGNTYALDDRQKHIYKVVQELLSPSNYEEFSSIADHLGKVGTEGEPERTVDVMEFYGALEHYKLLENKVTSERVAQLKAVSKQDATRIFKQCTRTDKGTYMARMTQVRFHEAVQLVAKVLQTPLNGQPSGQPMRPRHLVASRDPREIQNANTATLTEADKFVSHVRIKFEQQGELDEVDEDSTTGLAAIF